MKNILPSIIRPHRWFLLFLLIVNIALMARIVTTNQWSAWINGDKQSLLTLRYWTRDGFFNPHALLFMSNGYTPSVALFDATDLGTHAFGSWYVKDGQLLRRIYYNHYPVFYLLPLAIVSAVIGSEHKLLFQGIEVLISAFGVLFLYCFLYKQFRSRIAASVAAGTYALSTLYLDWAHALSNMPIDDFFRNGLLLLSVIEKQIEKAHIHAPLRAILHSPFFIRLSLWWTYFLLCFTSLDSMAFGFIWIVGLDFIHDRRIRWKRWFLFGLAPILARVVQFSQSLIKFGWSDAFADWFGRWNTMANQDGKTTILERFLSVSREVRYLLGFGYDKHRIIELHLLTFSFVALVALGLFLLARHARKRTGSWWNTPAMIPAVLFVAGMGFGLVFPGASWMSYEGRQYIPFFCALVVVVWIEWASLRGLPLKKWIVATLVIPAAFVAVRQFSLSAMHLVNGAPTYAFGRPAPLFAELGSALHQRVDNRTGMVFLYEPDGSPIPFIPNPQDPTYEEYAMDAQLLYAADAHVMVFKSVDRLTRDLGQIAERTDSTIIPYLAIKTPEAFDDLRARLLTLGYHVPSRPDQLTADGVWVGVQIVVPSPTSTAR